MAAFSIPFAIVDLWLLIVMARILRGVLRPLPSVLPPLSRSSSSPLSPKTTLWCPPIVLSRLVSSTPMFQSTISYPHPATRNWGSHAAFRDLCASSNHTHCVSTLYPIMKGNVTCIASDGGSVFGLLPSYHAFNQVAIVIMENTRTNTFITTMFHMESRQRVPLVTTYIPNLLQSYPIVSFSVFQYGALLFLALRSLLRGACIDVGCMALLL